MNSMMLIAGLILRPDSGMRGLAMTLDARAAGRADDRRMDGPRGQDHAVSGLQFQALALGPEGNGDRAVDAVEDLLEAVRVGRVAVSGSVRPRVASTRLGPQLRQDRKSTRLNSSHVKISYAGSC